ncbi:hypothetical protein ACUN0C_00970 [Faunimonas sp. B44]|uniref:hypothetical protein n=1 Tax=Faunimonas sp. B44 TaxID=3461493 RepID=UPI004044EB50
MADEEALLVVVRVDELAGDAVDAVAADFADCAVENVATVNLHLDLAVLGLDQVDVRLAEDAKRLPFHPVQPRPTARAAPGSPDQVWR